MNGLGFLIWKLSAMPPVDKLIPALQSVGCEWISIKVADGVYKYNVQGGSDAALKTFIQALQDAGIEVGGWHYVYPDKPGPQGDLAEERREKLGLSHYLLDIEGEWKGTYAPAARTLMDKLHGGPFTVGLCSYRYPSVHPIPWSAFLNHEKMDICAPQVYWLETHNPAEQLLRSEEEYRAKTDKPFIPIGPTFGVAGWEPSVDDLVKFVDTCEAREYPAYGFYSLDWIISHQKASWLGAIKDAAGDTPPAPPEPEAYRVVNCTWLNGRSEPKVVDDNRVVSVKAGQLVKSNHAQSGEWISVNLGLIDCWMHGDYLESA